jgi:hypothetical protein
MHAGGRAGREADRRASGRAGKLAGRQAGSVSSFDGKSASILCVAFS